MEKIDSLNFKDTDELNREIREENVIRVSIHIIPETDFEELLTLEEDFRQNKSFLIFRTQFYF